MAHEALPTVKCSSCGQSVPLADLGDHVCPPLPPLNARPLSRSPKSTGTLLPQRLQSLVSRSDSQKSSSSGGPSEDGEPEAVTPSRDPFHRLPPDQSHMSTPKTTPSPTSLTFDRDRPHLPGAPAPTPPPERVSTPLRDNLPPALQRARVPSNASRIVPASPTRVAFPLPFGESSSHPVPRRPSPLSSVHTPPPILQPRSSTADRAPSNPTPPLRPSLERSRTPSTVSTPGPSLDKSTPSLEKIRTSVNARRPSVDSQHPSIARNTSAASPAPFARPPRTTPSPGSVPFPSSVPTIPPPVSMRQPPPPPLSLPYSHTHVMTCEIDTKTGGEAGMAGVGRRGFEAAARAAMFAASRSPTHITPLGGGQRTNGAQYLETSSLFGHGMQVAITPPLPSPNSAQTPSPVSPFLASPIAPGSGTHANGQYPNLPSPHDAVLQKLSAPASSDKAPALPFSSAVRIASPSSPSAIPNPFERRLSGETITQSPLPPTTLPLPFFDVLKPELDLGNESDDESVYTTHTESKKDEDAPLSPSADSDVGLAYAQDSEDDTPVVMPLDIRKSALKGGMNKIKFPTSGSPDGRFPAGPSRQASASSLRSAASSRSVATSFSGTARTRSASAATQSTARSVGALERAMETLIEEGASVSVLASGSVLASIGGSTPGRGSGKPSRSNTVPGPASPEQKPPKLPARAHTNPSHPHIHSERVGLTGEVARIRNRGSTKRKDRICAGCNSGIDDGRWIQMDGGNVLCERCWKNMYLPKCRRCNLPIEKQAVSSRDGQLKGKYHKECFNCHTCQKPFPDKEFYVFDGKPFCAYHYHEANDSLCGASSCGQPIEGPCAVTHSGKRYHPEHLLCEFEDGCKERLEEYWEVDGQMFCERHAAFVGGRDGCWTRGHDPASETQTTREPGTDEGRMLKRMTRFIDLGAGGDDELDIR